MDLRGQLIRRTGPNWLRTFAIDLAASINIDIDDLIIEGRDGTGPKTEVPWFRFGSRQRSPSATTDWYCVFLFDTKGDAVYLSLAHGSTIWNGVDFQPRPESELRGLATWGREKVQHLASPRTDVQKELSLFSRRSPLGPAYEAGTALCLKYERSSIPDDSQLREDALFFASLLGRIYQESDSEPIPYGPAPEVLEIIEATDIAAGRKPSGTRGQGFRLSATQRTAIELHAMSMAKELLITQGWNVKDTSASKPYDFHCHKDDHELYVEVKGTTSVGDTIVVTRGEVEHHRHVFPNNALIVVSGISLEGADRNEAAGGSLQMTTPWVIDDQHLTVISYTYQATSHD